MNQLPNFMIGRRPVVRSTGDWIISANSSEVIASHVPDGQSIVLEHGGAKIVVHGDVGRGAVLVAIGGGAHVEVHGNVGDGSRIGARGGGARVEIHGYVGNAVVRAAGGGAKVELYKPSHADTAVSGGGAIITRRGR